MTPQCQVQKFEKHHTRILYAAPYFSSQWAGRASADTHRGYGSQQAPFWEWRKQVALGKIAEDLKIRLLDLSLKHNHSTKSTQATAWRGRNKKEEKYIWGGWGHSRLHNARVAQRRIATRHHVNVTYHCDVTPPSALLKRSRWARASPKRVTGSPEKHSTRGKRYRS